MVNSLTINQHTSARQLQDFLSNDVSRDGKLHAKANANGEVVLYEKPRPKGFMENVGALVDRVIGRTGRREELAATTIKEAISKVLDGTVKNQTQGAIAGRITENLRQLDKGGGPSVKDARELLMVARALPTPEGEKTVKTSGYPSLKTLGLEANDEIIQTSARALKSGGSVEDNAKVLGDAILKKFVDGNPGAKDREALAFSDGLKLMGELKSAIEAHLELKPDSELSPTIGQVVAQAFAEVASQVLADKPIKGTSTEIATKMGDNANLPNIRLGGEEFKPTKFLGAGGFANVFEYTSVGDPGHKIALKVTNNLDDTASLFGGNKNSNISSQQKFAETVQLAGEEIGLHKQAYGDGVKEVVGFAGAMRMPDGNIGVAMEIAPNGDAFDMGVVLLGDAVKEGKLTAEEADTLRLTMIKDMVRGLDHMHNKQNLTHFDFKSVNCFIGSDGTTKVGDFGLTQNASSETTTLDLDLSKKVENLTYKAPELSISEAYFNNESKVLGKLLKEEAGEAAVDRLRDHLAPLYKGGKLDEMTGRLLQNVMDNEYQQWSSDSELRKGGLYFDKKVDIWGLGSSALEMFTGRQIGQGQFFTDLEKNLTAYGSSPNNRPLSDPGEDGKPRPGALGLKTGNPQVDDLITSMLMPQPEQRLGTAELLNHPALKSQGGVDSKEARDLIVALKSGDAQKIDDARRALSALRQPPSSTVSSSSTPSDDLKLSVDEVFELLGGQQGGRV